jgi:hypothetical protein
VELPVHVCELSLNLVARQIVIRITVESFADSHSLSMQDVFLLPGEMFLYAVSVHSPSLATFIGIGRNPIVLTIVLSALGWILACLATWLAYRLVKDTIRLTNAVFFTAKHRLALGLGNFKTMITCRFRRWLPKRQVSGIISAPEEHFDKIDLAVLRVAAAQGPGKTTSAPELAERFGLRPAQFMQSLAKLHNNKMVDVVIGSTDGFENYRLTDYGAAYLSMWQRQDAAAA